MHEKEMINDLLSQLKSSLTTYAHAISESSNPQLRQTLQQIRNNCEAFQYDLYKLAEQKGYYQAAQKAEPSEIMQVKSQFMN
ncbi:MAG: spore coat protein [Clostridium sp.]|jgi:spore coat protein CotF|nr:spore coat protein [Clostridium sp.]